jgi:rubrerythrin
MEFRYLQDILIFALAKEESSVRFYRALAARVKNPDTMTIFQALTHQEEKHIDAVKLEMFKQGYTVSETSLKGIPDDEVSLELDAQAEQMSYLDALRMAVRKERAAFKLFAELMAMARQPDARNMLLELAEEEMRHVLQLEHEIQSFTQPHKG